MCNISIYGLALGAVSFVLIGLFHPLVIKAEYYFGKKVWWAFLLNGILFAVFSLFCTNEFLSVSFGMVAFASFWSIKEIFEQVRRVKQGRFPKNPKRTYSC